MPKHKLVDAIEQVEHAIVLAKRRYSDVVLCDVSDLRVLLDALKKEELW